MLRSRIIPCLLIHNKGLVKTIKFESPKYVGDPVNAVKIFNEKEVDELIVLDIDATRTKRPPDFNLIRNIAVECRMPFCYGGGVTSVEEVKNIISLGVEKVAISSTAVTNLPVIDAMSKAVGAQSIVIVLDILKRELSGDYEIYIQNGKIKTGKKVRDFILELNKIEIGEIIINSIDRDGTMAGYDFKLVDIIRDLTDVPITVIGGAGSFDDIKLLVERYKIIGAGAGSIFVFKGKYKAVLITYPTKKEKKLLL
jgi:cyclase